DLEKLGRRQELLQNGKGDMIEKFTRALVVLERETYDAQKRVEQLQGIHESFLQHQQYLDSINPKSWEGMDINKELTKALSAVDDARAEDNKSVPKVSPEYDTDRGDPMAASAGFQIDYQGTEADHSFVYW